MEITVPRRRFFVTAGLGAAGAMTLPLSRLAAQRQPPSRDDAVMDHVGREFALLYMAAKRGPLYAEHYQSIAANLRLMAMVYPDVRAAAKKSRGPHRHDRRARDVEEVRKHFGIDISGEPEPAPLTAADEAKARAQLAAEGLGPTLLRMADAAAAKASQVARVSDAGRFRSAQWYLMCTYQPVAQVASVVICEVAQQGAGGAPVQIACRVSQVVVVLWSLVC